MIVLLFYRLEAYDRNDNFGSTGSDLTHTDDWHMSVPGPMKFRDVTGNTDLPPITMRKITQFLQPLGTSLNKDAQELYDER